MILLLAWPAEESCTLGLSGYFLEFKNPIDQLLPITRMAEVKWEQIGSNGPS